MKDAGKALQPEPAKEECPSTFGPIVTDTAIPIEKGKFALQPTFGLGFVTNKLQPKLAAGLGGRQISRPLAWIANSPTACGITWRSLLMIPYHSQLGRQRQGTGAEWGALRQFRRHSATST